MRYQVLHTVKLCPSFLEVDGSRIAEAGGETSFLTDLYHRLGLDYSKFFKMDILSKVGFLASEFLLEQEAGERFVPRDDRAVLLFNRYSSMHQGILPTQGLNSHLLHWQMNPFSLYGVKNN